MNFPRPSVKIHVSQSGEPFLKEVLAGLEEEGVLFEVHISEEKDSEELAHEAAVSSVLEVGIGIDKESISVTMAKLPASTPLLKYSTTEFQKLRLIGSNGARLAKGNILKL